MTNKEFLNKQRADRMAQTEMMRGLGYITADGVYNTHMQRIVVETATIRQNPYTSFDIMPIDNPTMQ